MTGEWGVLEFMSEAQRVAYGVGGAFTPDQAAFVMGQQNETAPTDTNAIGQETPAPMPTSPSGPLTDSAPRTGITYSCGGCDIRWSGVSRAHCSGCHQTFAGIGPFDRHRRDIKGIGTCLDPETIVSTKTGDREMYLTNGLWSSVENPAPRGQHLRRSS